MQKITPFLWFDGQAEEAANFYASIFKDSRITSITRTDEAIAEASGQPVGSVLMVEFTMNGQDFVALNGGPAFKFNEAVSFQINCESQEEVDYYWSSLTADGGEESMCGWLKDKFGLSWQVTPVRLMELMTGPDRQRAQRAAKAMLGMQKIDIAEIERAANSE